MWAVGLPHSGAFTVNPHLDLTVAGKYWQAARPGCDSKVSLQSTPQWPPVHGPGFID